MRWSPLLSVVFGLSIATGRLLSQETAADQRPASPDARPVSLLRETSAAHFHLVLGRLQLDPVRYRKSTHNRQTPVGEDLRMWTQSLSIDAQRGRPTLHYCSQSPDRLLTLDVNDRGKVQLESASTSGGIRVVITQNHGLPISIRRYHDGRSEEQLVATWIHFCVAAPELYRDHFEPLIDDLLYPVRLSELAQRAQDQSIADILRQQRYGAADLAPSALAPSPVDDQTLHQWIASLGSTSRLHRIEAQRNLHDQGIALLPRLAQVDRRSLDAEQTARLNRLVQQLTPRSDDNVARIAVLIRDDSSYWAAAADRLSGPEQSLIAARFQGLDGPGGLRVATAPPIDSPQRH